MCYLAVRAGWPMGLTRLNPNVTKTALVLLNTMLAGLKVQRGPYPRRAASQRPWRNGQRWLRRMP